MHDSIVIFDIGEVLVTPATLIEDLSARVAADVTLFEAAYWRHRLDYDLGLETYEYWIDVLENLSIPATATLVDDLVRIDTHAWTTIRPDAAALLEELHIAGIRIGVLSNATVEMAHAARTSRWGRWVSEWFFSVDLGMAKPDPEVFSYVTHRVGLPPQSIVFLDDSQRSVDAALEEGWNAHQWRSGDGAAAFLASCGLIR